MSLTTNIILTSGLIITKPYVIEYFPATADSVVDTYYFKRYCDNENIQQSVSAVLHSEKNNIVKSGNEWYIEDAEGGTECSVPNARIRLYFPQYSVDTNRRGSMYMLTASTYIKGRYVNLGSYMFKRVDALACPIKTFGSSDQYVEYIELPVPDLYSILFDSRYNTIKSAFGYDDDNKQLYSSLNFSLYVVDWMSSSESFIKASGCNSGQNSVLIADFDELRATMFVEFNNKLWEYALRIGWEFDNDLGNNIGEYINNIYGIEQNNIKVCIRWVIMDRDNIYQTGVVVNKLYNNYTIDLSNVREDFFKNWDNWKDGLVLKASVSLVDGSEETGYTDDDIYDGNFISFLVVFANSILITQDMYAQLLYDSSDNFPPIINLKSQTMDYNDIHVTNEIINKITVSDWTPVKDTKNHIVQPVFYQTRNLDSITINAAVTENIALQLDSYKSQVKQFLLQVEGVLFKEIGRTANGVIFKVTGKELPKEVVSGTYYVLNQDCELVTSGAYNYNL